LRISASIIVRNEEENIAAVCETVAWADEVVIVDSDSQDRTVEIARRYSRFAATRTSTNSPTRKRPAIGSSGSTPTSV
jgi:glycosyltransferase involved in cell wall biosynthesis